jgi:hypothetical protein
MKICGVPILRQAQDDIRFWQRPIVPSHHVILSLSKDGHATIASPAEI